MKRTAIIAVPLFLAILPLISVASVSANPIWITYGQYVGDVSFVREV